MRTQQESQFTTHDGTSLFYRFWPAQGGSTDKAVVLFHRGHEHSGRVAHLADELGLPDFAIFAWDARGNGRSPGVRGYSPSLTVSVKDVDTFVKHFSAAHGIPIGNIAVVEQSVGAVLVAAWAHDYAPRVRCLVLASPAFKVKLYVPLARTGLRLMHALVGNFFVNSYVKAKFLTHDPQRIASYESDPLIARPISVNILLALHDTAERIVAVAQAITLPTQLLVSGNDWVVHRKPQDVFFARLGSPIKERHVLAGFYHDTLGELNRKLAVDKVRDFITRMFAQAPRQVSLLDAHRSGYTCDEQRVLERPLPALSAKAIGFATVRAGMSTLGRLSDGVRLGFETGFDSGSTLDYVYRNRAQGRLGIGRLLDRNYLDAIGWRGIRFNPRPSLPRGATVRTGRHPRRSGGFNPRPSLPRGATVRAQQVEITEISARFARTGARTCFRASIGDPIGLRRPDNSLTYRLREAPGEFTVARGSRNNTFDL